MNENLFKYSIFALIIGSIYMLSVPARQLISSGLKNFSDWRLRKIENQRDSLKEMMLFIDPKKLVLLNTACPVVSTIAFTMIIGLNFGSYVLGAIVGLVIGFIIPSIVVKQAAENRRNKFKAQITDGLTILNSCLKGGLSLLQAIEALAEELPPPISQEFGMILRENKMGMPLEESFEKLNKRLPSEELNLLTTAILVARETGGDITQLFGTLINTIRAKMKLLDNVKTLSMQGRIQGIVMSCLPIVFVFMVISFNKRYFDIMLANPTGRMLLAYAVASEIVGAFLIAKFSKMNL